MKGQAKARQRCAKRHVEKLLRRITALHQTGKKRGLVGHLIVEYLRSYDARRLAVQRADHSLKKGRRVGEASQRARLTGLGDAGPDCGGDIKGAKAPSNIAAGMTKIALSLG